MSDIQEIDVARVNLPLTTLNTSYGTGAQNKEHVFVRINAGNVYGYGEASVLPHFTGEIASTVEKIIREQLAPTIKGINVLNHSKIHSVLDKTLPNNTSAKAAIDFALYDVVGKLIGFPASYFLGGQYRKKIKIAAGIGIVPPKEAAKQAAELSSMGAHTIKLKIGNNLERDIATATAVRNSCGPQIGIRLDANQGYNFSQACQLLRNVSDLNIEYLEQPLLASEFHSLSSLRQMGLGIPIAVDESLYGPKSALEIVKERAADVLVVKLIKTGGLYRANQVLSIAESAGLTCTIVSPYETSLGIAAGLHLAASSPAVSWACEFIQGQIKRRENNDKSNNPKWPVTPKNLLVSNGYISVPDDPGLGVNVVNDIFS